jgi:serine palmitoyltransferase
LIEEWQPEPLVAKKQADPRVIDVDHVQVKKRYVIDSMLDREIDLKVIPVNYNKSKNEKEVKIKALNMTTVGFLGAQSHPEILKKSEEAIRRYGPGSCGPRGFYGTIDVHIELEKKLAGFMGFEEAVLFGSGFATISSVIPAFSKQPDYLLVDKACNYAIQTGVNLSRSEVRWFNHNDIKDLERILQSLKDVFVKKQQKVFVVVEALYGHSGDLAPLKELIALKVRDVARSTIVRVLYMYMCVMTDALPPCTQSKYPIRLLVDESNSLGVLGEQGRGLVYETVKQLPVPGPSQPPHVEMVCASLGGPLGAIGGVALGSSLLCAHMRLNCSGYVYSCSNPPYVTAAACAVVDMLLADQPMHAKLRTNIQLLHKTLAKTELPGLTVDTCQDAPFAHLRLKRSTGSRERDEQLLQRISDQVSNHSCVDIYISLPILTPPAQLLDKEQICVLVPRVVKQERFKPEPSLRLCISAVHRDEDIPRTLNAVASVARQVLV